MAAVDIRADMADVKKRWEAYWQGESNRPMLWADCPKPDMQEEIKRLLPQYPQRPNQEYEKFGNDLVEIFENCYDYVADETPIYDPSFGPDQLCGFYGQTIEYSEDSGGTSWSKAIDKELEDLIPMIKFDETNPMLKEMQKYHKTLAKVFDGRIAIGGLDYHSNFDAICSLRDPVNACMDLLEKPEVVKEALNRVNETTKAFYNMFYDLGNMAVTGTSSWLQGYSEKKYQTINADFTCLLSPAQVDEFIIPCLESECEALDYAIYHLDGPDAMKHTKSVCSIDKIKAIQWQPGAGREPSGPYWMDYYKEILSYGTGIWLNAEPDEVKVLHKELKSNKIIYITYGTKKEMEDLAVWLEKY